MISPLPTFLDLLSKHLLCLLEFTLADTFVSTQGADSRVGGGMGLAHSAFGMPTAGGGILEWGTTKGLSGLLTEVLK